ncbi:MAG: hypothetical protein KF770_26645, partial [Anaerolineae bacterium]|nr:hypothetical protein [Anaerolineae bacterium]
MKRKSTILLNSIILFFGVTLFANCSNNPNDDERFVLWGQDVNGQCYIWNVDVKGESNTQFVSEHR